MELLLTVEQAAERLQIKPYTVREHLKRGILRGIKRGRLWRVPESALVESSAQMPTTTQEQGVANSTISVSPIERAPFVFYGDDVELENEILFMPRQEKHITVKIVSTERAPFVFYAEDDDEQSEAL